MGMMDNAVELHDVIVDGETEKAFKVRIYGKLRLDQTEHTFWCPKNQVSGRPVTYTRTNIKISKWFWSKIKPSIEETGVPMNFFTDGGVGTFSKTINTKPATLPVMQPTYEMLTLKTPQDAREFITSLIKFFNDPMKLEQFLEGNLVVLNGKIHIAVDIDVKNLLLNGLEEFKSELIQSALQEYFKDLN